VPGTITFPGAKDIEYLPAIGQRGWILVTKDQHIRRNRLEIDAILNSGVRAFVLTGAELRAEEQGQLILSVMRKIYRICTQRGPFIYLITRSGIFTRMSNRRLRRIAKKR